MLGTTLTVAATAAFTAGSAAPDGAMTGSVVGASSGTDPATLIAIAVGGLGLTLGTFAIWRGRRHDRLADAATTDGLTGLRNRRMFDLDVDAQVTRGDQPTSMLMVDIDHFKRFNDTYGHAVGDDVLCRVGAVLAQQIRKGDVAYRYGGEEFCVLLPGADRREATAVAERIRTAIEALELPVEATVTASVGVAAGRADVLDRTIGRADSALYDAKRAGRNRVSVG